jgi:hypothetical protein
VLCRCRSTLIFFPPLIYTTGIFLFFFLIFLCHSSFIHGFSFYFLIKIPILSSRHFLFFLSPSLLHVINSTEPTHVFLCSQNRIIIFSARSHLMRNTDIFLVFCINHPIKICLFPFFYFPSLR